VNWPASTAADVASYRLYSRAFGGSWTNQSTALVNSAVFRGLKAGDTWEFTAEGYNSANRLCELYQQVTFTVPTGDTSVVQIAQTRAKAGPLDRATKGAWKGNYGAKGYLLAGYSSSWPNSWVNPVSGGTLWVWNLASTDASALQAPSSLLPVRVAAAWFSNGGEMRLNVPASAGGLQKLSVYCLDYQASGLSDTLQIADSSSGAVLASLPMTQFQDGAYGVFYLKPPAQLTVRASNGGTAVFSGAFLDAAPVLGTSTM
jgi:hypothetical protein